MVVDTHAGSSVVIDTGSGTRIVEVRSEPSFVDGPHGPSAVLLTDPDGSPGQQALVVSADRKVRRGDLGRTTIGRYEVTTLAGVAEPGPACAARVLSALPPLVQYGTWLLPADLVTEAPGR